MDEANQADGPHVLIIEDDLGHQRLLEIVVKRLGCRCDCAFDGRSGLARAMAEKYDIIFVDIHIPEMDGFVVVSELRERGFKGPVIAITALKLEGLDRKALKAGFDDFLRKPIEQAVVQQIIQKSLHPRGN